MDRDFKAETKGKANGYETRKTPRFYTYEIFLLPDGDPNAKGSYSGSPQSSCGDDGSREQAVERLSKRELQQPGFTLGLLLDTHFNEQLLIS